MKVSWKVCFENPTTWGHVYIEAQNKREAIIKFLKNHVRACDGTAHIICVPDRRRNI